MRRKIVIAITIIICFLLQSTLFQTLSFSSISPNLLIVVTAAFGFMRGKKEGLFVGFFCGIIIDIFFGSILGFNALVYMIIGYCNGIFKKIFYPEEIKLPIALIAASGYLFCAVLLKREVRIWLLSCPYYSSRTGLHNDFISGNLLYPAESEPVVRAL